MKTTDDGTTIITIHEGANFEKRTPLHAVPKTSQVEHKPICSVDGKPWPCIHSQRETHLTFSQWYNRFCLACGKQQTAYVALNIDCGLDGRAIYFHDRKRCRPAAERWWNENVLPLTGEPYRKGQIIGDLLRYVGARSKPHVATQA